MWWSFARTVHLETIENPDVRLAIAIYMNGTPWSYGSPVNLVSPNDPPVFMLHGSLDDLVEPSQSYQMAGALDSQGVDRILKIYDGAGHDLYYPVSPSYAEALNDTLVYTKAITQ